MNFLFRRIFWGLVILLIGILFLLNNVFKLNIPVWNMVWPVVIILIGLSILSRKRGVKTENNIIFDESYVKISKETKEYTTVFGKGRYDFRNMHLGKESMEFEVNSVFGATDLLIDENTPTIIRATSAFGGVQFPNGETVAFSDRIYKTKAYKEGAPCVHIKASAVFGGMEIKS